MKKTKPIKLPKAKPATIRLDLSYGVLPEGHQYVRPEGFDPRSYPWKLANESVEEAHSAYLLVRVPSRERIQFMNELWRVLVPNGKCSIIVPYWSSARATQDPTSEWPPFSEQSFLYFNKGWMVANKLDYGLKCDFDFQFGYTLDPETTSKSDDVRPFWNKHYTNAIQDLHVVLTKRP